MKASNKSSLEWVYIAKGIGILLVVIGHFYPEGSPRYWTILNQIIYSFHMPLFFILSGFLYDRTKYTYPELIWNKVQRLLYPFITIAILFFGIKFLAGMFVRLDHPVDLNSFIALFVNPADSYMPLLWFVLTLFLIFVFYPLARRFMNDFVLLALLVVVTSILGTNNSALGLAITNMPFFIFGVILRENQKLSGIVSNGNWRYTLVSVLVFATAYLVLEPMHGIFEYVSSLLIGAAGSWMIISASQMISTISNMGMKVVVGNLGIYLMSIYLFHTLFESAIRIGFIQVLRGFQVPFEIIAFLAIICGLVFPLILEKYFLRKFWFTRKFLLGIS